MCGRKGVEAVGRVCRGYRRDLEQVVSSADAQGPKKLECTTRRSNRRHQEASVLEFIILYLVVHAYLIIATSQFTFL